MALSGLVQNFGRHPIQSGQIEIEHHSLTTQQMNGARDSLGCNNLLAYSHLCQASNCATCTTALLKMLKKNWGAIPTANMRSITGTIVHFSLGLRSGKPATASASGPLKSDCIARIKTTAVKS